MHIFAAATKKISVLFLTKRYFPVFEPNLQPHFKHFIDLGVCLIYALSGISEHSSGLGRSPLALWSHQSFNSLSVFGAVRWSTVTRVFVNVNRSSPFSTACVSSVCLLRCAAALLKDPFIVLATVLFSILCVLAYLIHPTIPTWGVRTSLSLTCSVLVGCSLKSVVF